MFTLHVCVCFPQEDIYENYQRIKFQPDQFHSYLLSPEVGFQRHKYIGIPQNKSKGQWINFTLVISTQLLL